MSNMFLPSITIAEPSPDMLRAIASVLEQESIVITLNRKDVVDRIEQGLQDAELVEKARAALLVDEDEDETSTTQDNPLGNESTVFAKPASGRPRGRPKKQPEVVSASVGGVPAEIVAQTPTTVKSIVPVNPVVEMPNGVVLNAPVVHETVGTAAAPVAEAKPITLAGAVADYANAFKIAALSALAKKEGVIRFTELPEARQSTLAQEMTRAVILGVALV